MGHFATIYTLAIYSFFAVWVMMLVGAAPVDAFDRVSGEMPSAGRPEPSDVAAGDSDASLQPSFDNLDTDFSRSLMPCPDEPMNPLFGPGPVCQPQHGKA